VSPEGAAAASASGTDRASGLIMGGGLVPARNVAVRGAAVNMSM
jgi:hypothetical protein